MTDSLIDKIKTVLPVPLFVTEPAVEWERIESEYSDFFAPLQATEQDKIWHREGNVWTHTKMAVEELLRQQAWRESEISARLRLFLAALLHDVGKSTATRVENGRIISPNHSRLGAQNARVFLWRLGLNTDPRLIRFREEIVALVRRHSLPVHLLERPDPLRDVVQFSFLGKNSELAMLAEADLRGRRGDDNGGLLEKIGLFREFAQESGVWEAPFPFISSRSAFGYFSQTLDYPTEMLYDNTWGEVVLMSGLPAAGKDTYIQKRCAAWPVVSLDKWRKRLKFDWTKDQSKVADAARREAADYLRRKTPFVWNATFLRKDFRRSAIRLCADYGARVKIVWREASFDELRRRNRQRAERIADSAYEKLFKKMELPTVLEADALELNPDV